MYKKVFLGFVISINFILNSSQTFAAESFVASLSEAKIKIKDNLMTLQSYKVNDSNYFKLRDVAKLVDVFVDYDNRSNMPIILSNKEYTIPTSSISEPNKTKSIKVNLKFVPINFDNQVYYINSCNINGFNYFKLRDISDMMTKSTSKYFNISWNDKTQIISLDIVTNKQQTLTTQLDPNYNNLEDFQKKIYDLVNIQRKKAGLESLKIDLKLMEIAMKKTKEMSDLDYFSHISPEYGNPTAYAKHFGYQKPVAENISNGGSSAEDVMNMFMSSQGHRDNILNPQYTHIGVGYYKKDNKSNLLSAQMFSIE